MGLFSKKKDEVKPELPKFPEFPQFHAEQAAYQPEFSMDAKPLPQALPEEPSTPAVMNHDDDIQIPVRKPMSVRPESTIQQPTPQPMPFARPQQQEVSDRPLFIKVDDYREAMGNIEALKRTLQETEELLEKLESIRMAEEEELKHAKSNVDAIKEQLLFIDKRLFEV
ncbi:MAG: hypothetical protein Q7R96_06615 [Nanoarchaeota archaeon]|nr:hypothetical protein [Nanoarchaeota archaeon]